MISFPTCLDYSFIKASALGKGQYKLYEAIFLKLGRDYELHTWSLVSIHEPDSSHFQSLNGSLLYIFSWFPCKNRTSGNSHLLPDQEYNRPWFQLCSLLSILVLTLILKNLTWECWLPYFHFIYLLYISFYIYYTVT